MNTFLWSHTTSSINLARAGAIADCLCILVASLLPCSRIALTLPPLSPAIIILVTTVAIRQQRGWQRQLPSASWVVIPIGPAATTDAILPAINSATVVRTRPLLQMLRWHHRSRHQLQWTRRPGQQQKLVMVLR